MGSGLSIIPGMVDYSKTDLRFPASRQQAHDAQIIHLVLFIHSLEMFIFSLWGLTPEYARVRQNRLRIYLQTGIKPAPDNQRHKLYF